MALPSFRTRVRFLSLSLAVPIAAAATYIAACGGDDSDAGGGTSVGDGGRGTLPDAALGKADGDSPATTMRLAHVASDLGPVDFCYRAVKTSSFEGPVLGGGFGGAKRDAGTTEGGADASDDAATADDAGLDDDAGDAGAASIGYRAVTRYLTLRTSGPLTIALVPPGATSCAAPLFTYDVTLDPGKLATVAIVGRSQTDAGGNTGLALVAFIDDRSTTMTSARVRMIHAAFGSGSGRGPSGALSVRGVGAQTVTLAERVEPKRAGSQSAAVPVDSLGYAVIAPLPSPAQLAVGAAADTISDGAVDSWVSQASELDLRGGSLHTGFILTGESGQPFEVLWCTDTSTTGDRATCSVVR